MSELGPLAHSSNLPTAIADSGSTGHFLAIDTPNLQALPTTAPITVALPDGSTIQSTHTAELDLLPLPKSARTAHLFPALTNTSLLSIGKLADAGCTATFNKHYLIIKWRGRELLKGNRCPHTGLWQVPLQTKPFHHQAHTITNTSKASDLVKFSHSALFSPVISTLEKALQNHYIKGFPGLTAAALKKYPPHSVATAKGHLDQARANTQSTKPKPSKPNDNSTAQETAAELFPAAPEKGNSSEACYASIETFKPSRQVHTDQTGKFPVTSNRGMKYVFILYDYDSNSIHPVPIKNRSAESILKAYQQVQAKLIKAGLRPKLHRLDNECSELLKDYMIAEEEDYQLVPPGNHRRN